MQFYEKDEHGNFHVKDAEERSDDSCDGITLNAEAQREFDAAHPPEWTKPLNANTRQWLAQVERLKTLAKRACGGNPNVYYSTLFSNIGLFVLQFQHNAEPAIVSDPKGLERAAQLYNQRAQIEKNDAEVKRLREENAELHQQLALAKGKRY